MTRISSTAAIVALLAALACAPAAATITVVMDGTAYPAHWRDSADLVARLHVPTAPGARHLQGSLDGIAGSWLRVSRINGQWQGLVAMNGRHYVVDAAARADRFGNLTLTARVPDALSGAQCAAVAPSGMVVHATIGDLAIAAATFASLCPNTVDGVCLLPELEVAFDQLFQQHVPNYQDAAIALLNMVDGYYQNGLSIRFDAITVEFLTSDVFDTTTDSSAFLSDIRTKKDTNQLPFIKNKRAILHVVTGRNFDGSTVGIASVGSLCQTFGNVGTTQFTSTLGLTALVMTHEIGHNFGAVHDVDDNTCGAGFIMDATLSPAATQFSACSIDEMTTSIEGLSNPSTCFEYPVDASIAARPDNPTTAGANEDFTVAFDVAEAHAAVAASELTLTGTLSGAAGSFTTAAVNGIACSVAGASYTCNTAAAGGLLEVTARVNGSGAMTVHANVAASASGSVKDIDPTNDAAAATVQAGTPPAAPTLLNAVAAANGELRIDLSWQDNSTNEDGFVVERRAGSAAFQELASLGPDVSGYSDATVGTGLNYTYRVAAFGSGGTSAPATSAPVLIAAPAKSNSGGGGGGAFGAELAPLLGLLLWRRRRTG